ncbi:unnamed protein product, partial [Staurois parvus]
MSDPVPAVIPIDSVAHCLARSLDAVPAVEPNDLMPGDPMPTAVQPRTTIQCLTQCQRVMPIDSEPTVVP